MLKLLTISLTELETLETFVPNYVSITRAILKVLDQTQMGIFPISGFLVNPVRKKIVLTLEPVMTLT